MFRFVICIDVEAGDLDVAYSKLYDTMKIVDTEDFQWESSDEAYDNDGGEIDPEELSRARMKIFAERDNRCEGCGEAFTYKDIDGGRCLSCGRMIS